MLNILFMIYSHFIFTSKQISDILSGLLIWILFVFNTYVYEDWTTLAICAHYNIV